MDELPFRAAWRTRDLQAWAEALAPDVVLRSPIIRKPFEGREAALELYAVLFDALGDFDITDEFVAGDSQAFYWFADAGGRRIEGTDLLRLDQDGKIIEVRVLIRPLVDIAAFAAAIGPPLARKRGPVRGVLARVLTVPLRGFLAVVDAISSRLVLRR